MSLLEQTNLADPVTQEDPTAYHHALQDQPLYFDDQLGFWICSRYKLMREILRNTRVFSSVGSQTMDSLKEPPEEVEAIRRTMYPQVNTMVTNDPPDHTRIRHTMDPPFKPRAIMAVTDRVRKIVDDVLDDFIDQGHCEFVSAFAIPIPIQVIADMLGVPRSLAGKIKEWSDASVEPLGMMITPERHIECTRLVKEFQDYFAEQLNEREKAPRQDLLTDLVQARLPDGEPFTMAQKLSITSQLLVAGNETTTNGLAAGMELLIRNPEQQALLRNEPERTRVFVNEVLRLESPVQGLFRVVKEDIEIGGVNLKAGDRVMCRFAAASRDPEQYERPDELDITRHNSGTNLAFGAGIHHCLGANLAREEMVQSFEAITQRMDKLAFVEGKNDFHHHPSMILRGLEALHIRFRKT